MKLLAAVLVAADAAPKIAFSLNNHNGYDYSGDLLGTISQYAHDNGNTYDLGTFKKISGNKISYSGGDWCGPIGAGRMSTVTYKCGSVTEIHSVKESSTCNYDFVATIGDCASKYLTNPCDVDNGGCKGNSVCSWAGPGNAPACKCPSPFAVPPNDPSGCELPQCSWNVHGCDADATCIEADPDNGKASTSCECNSPLTGDGYTCTMCPSNDECWNYNATTHTCSMDPDCSALTCGSLAIDIAMEPELFGLTDPDSAIWVSNAQPSWDNGKLRYSKALGDSDQRVFMSENEEKVVAEVSFAIGGENRQRSAALAHEIDLGDMAVYTSNVGIQVLYRCEYETALTVSSESFDVQTVTAFGENAGIGNLVGGFSMSLSSPTSDGERFIMGGQLEVGISWSASLLSAFSFRIQECTITHGDTSVDVIKQGCFAGLLEAQPVETESNLSSAFAFNMFKALDEESATQFLSCEVKVCKDYCDQAVGTGDCPVDDVMAFARA